MATTGGLVRVLAWFIAISLAAATVLYAAITFDLIAPQPNLPDNAGLIDNLLAQGAHLRAIWSADLGSSLLYALGFMATVLIARPLASLARPGDARAGAMTGAFMAAGIVGIVAQLMYIGTHDVINAIAYCDCGFIEQEVISQSWARFLSDSAVSWLINGTGVLLLAGFALAGAAVGWRRDARRLAVPLLGDGPRPAVERGRRRDRRGRPRRPDPDRRRDRDPDPDLGDLAGLERARGRRSRRLTATASADADAT